MTRRRLLAWLYVVPGLGFGIGTIAVLGYQWRRGELPMTPFGWRLLGGTVPGMGEVHLTRLGGVLAWLLVGSSFADAAIGAGLARHRGNLELAALLLAPITFGLAVLFQLPGLLLVAPIRALLLVMGPGDRTAQPVDRA